ncbi:hypothetical protein JNW91_29000 [Micromonospora sp. STR1_7]|uniref:Uncharacterized protein n=1 Tax=Micromonospora parastrephiae TaxID=2806101 RepID=A0ABS1Y1T8_9ACTN|nr:hypothetical protein [Micromonospora parastrephiae]MBM0235462.1 hypothetical protein [Micromonospora parastrephiae]
MSIDFAAVKAANANANVAPDVRQMADGLGVDLRTVNPQPGRKTLDVNDVVMAHNRRATTGNPTYDVTPRSAQTASGPYTGSGNTLPAFTASGLDPKVLLRYPAPVRPALAALPTLAEAYHVGQSYLGLTDQEARERLSTDTRIPTEYAYAWTDADHIEPGGSGAPSAYQPDAAIARNSQARMDYQARERARMKAEAERRGDYFTYRNY